jgi:hypothetical protein
MLLDRDQFHRLPLCLSARLPTCGGLPSARNAEPIGLLQAAQRGHVRRQYSHPFGIKKRQEKIMESGLFSGDETPCVPADWSEDDAPPVIRSSWNVMVVQLAGTAPEPIRVSDFGRAGRVVTRLLSGGSEEYDLDEEDAEVSPREPTH